MNEEFPSDVPMPRPLVVLFGGSGFIGRHTSRIFIDNGWRVRVASRPTKHSAPSDFAPHTEHVAVDLSDVGSLIAALDDAAVAVNLTGILSPSRGQSFDHVHHRGAGAIAMAVAEKNIEDFVHVSAIGANPNSLSVYARSKAYGEEVVRAAVPTAVVLRPSIVFGAEDSFFNRFAEMAKYSPFLPLIGGGKTRFQPVAVDDVAKAILFSVSGKAQPGKIYELGGPDTQSFADLLKYICVTTGKRRILLPLSFALAKAVATVIECMNAILFGHLPKMLLITRDQVELLRADNVVSPTAQSERRTLAGLGITPTPIASVVPHYLSKK